MDNTTATTEATVPPVDWKAMHELDWNVPLIMLGIFAGFYFFGVLCSLVGLFCSLWIVWGGVMLAQYGVGAIFVNPIYIAGTAFVLAAITWVILVGLFEVTMAPSRIWKHFTR